MIAFGDMMKKQIVMPAHLMDDNEHAKNNGPNRNLFVDFANVAERSGTYTAMDYADIVDYLIKKWKVRAMGVGAGVPLSRSSGHCGVCFCAPSRLCPVAGL